jgi:ABC transport system ATP-binding/permease protein
MMASRWAFEALAVNQFKENAYEKTFYKQDKRISIASYKKDYWMQKLSNKVVKIENELKAGKKASELKYDIDLLHDELKKEQEIYSKKEFASLDDVTPERYNEATGSEIRNYLNNTLKNHYINLENSARKKQNDLILGLIKKLGNDGLVNLKDKAENQNLIQLVKNENDISGEKCLEKDGRLIQRTDPIFQDPTESKLGRAHFFAPRKNLFGIYYSTFGFNMFVIWIMSFMLIITLYFDVFKNVLDGIERLFSIFKKKKHY